MLTRSRSAVEDNREQASNVNIATEDSSSQMAPGNDRSVDSDTPMSDTNMIGLLPIFCGKDNESVTFFAEQFREVASLTSWSERHKAIILKTRLRDKAAEFLAQNRAIQREQNVTKIMQMLEEKFQPGTTALRKQWKFQNIELKPTQTFDEIAQQIDELGNDYLGISTEAAEETKRIADNIKLAKFMEIIPTEIKTQLRTENVGDFEKAVLRAKELNTIYEEESNSINAVRIRTPKCDTPKNAEDLDSLKNQIAELKETIQQLTIQKEQCNWCLKSGHSIEQCRSRLRAINQTTTHQGQNSHRTFQDNFRRGSNQTRGGRISQEWDRDNRQRRDSPNADFRGEQNFRGRNSTYRGRVSSQNPRRSYNSLN